MHGYQKQTQLEFHSTHTMCTLSPVTELRVQYYNINATLGISTQTFVQS